MFSDVSSDECVDALVLAGYRVVRRTASSVVLERGLRSIMVPRGGHLAPEALEAVLLAANVPLRRFTELLCEVPTRPDLICV